jgi:hypothetical protein
MQAGERRSICSSFEIRLRDQPSSGACVCMGACVHACMGVWAHVCMCKIAVGWGDSDSDDGSGGNGKVRSRPHFVGMYVHTIDRITVQVHHTPSTLSLSLSLSLSPSLPHIHTPNSCA